ncbi:uncharacterized protein LOC105227315 [Bactrocera dorsalis]|uniref:Uncharacterized protein LOC105227315 n=1 Tax=Bactrocera dorsalis TaxID=27457 RepID=A0A6I9V1D6_BACDO|nr:uncharacterized protein LOC105227315 [Bactrocera dorsalis]
MHFSAFVATVSLAILGLATLTRAATPSNTAAAAASSTVNTASTDLQSDLRDFQALIPRRRIGYIAARHYIVDARFRSALAFIRSPEFSATWQQIRNTSDFAELLSLMRRDAGSFDVTTIIDRIPNQLRAFNIPSKVPVNMMVQRTVSDFLGDVVRELPRARIASLMARKVQAGGEFSQLYRTVRSEEFGSLLQKTRKSSSLAAPIRKLNQNFIDVDNIIKIGFNVLNWGP